MECTLKKCQEQDVFRDLIRKGSPSLKSEEREVRDAARHSSFLGQGLILFRFSRN